MRPSIILRASLFQSAPDPKAGRNVHGSGSGSGGREVSIRSRPEGREELAGRLAGAGAVRFQSAPDPKAGRNCDLAERGTPASRFNPLPTRRPGGTTLPLLSRPVAAMFQSAPDPKAGRNRLGWRRWPSTIMFQSAPDPKAGRNLAGLVAEADGHQFQSAPDPKAGRNFVLLSNELPRLVSIRSRPEGREERDDRRLGDARYGVSIRSRPEGREERLNARMLGRKGLFQSAPDPKAGRNPEYLPHLEEGLAVSIRSRPEGREERDGGVGMRGALTKVSIRSRPEGREELAGAEPGEADPDVSIRSRPEGREELTILGLVDLNVGVSIRSRPEGREEQRLVGRGRLGQLVSIRSRPEGREERSWVVTHKPVKQFQSAPDPKAGRNSARSRPTWSRRSFNPLPTRRPGGTGRGRGDGHRPTVSIRSRPEGREERQPPVDDRPHRQFQSAPDPKAGRNSWPRSRPCRPRGFNPLPTRRPGGTRDRPCDRRTQTVSIRSRPEGREERHRPKSSPTEGLGVTFREPWDLTRCGRGAARRVEAQLIGCPPPSAIAELRGFGRGMGSASAVIVFRRSEGLRSRGSHLCRSARSAFGLPHPEDRTSSCPQPDR